MHFQICINLSAPDFYNKETLRRGGLTRRVWPPVAPVVLHIDPEGASHQSRLHLSLETGCPPQVPELGEHAQLACHGCNYNRATKAGVRAPAVVYVGLVRTVEFDFVGVREFIRVHASGYLDVKRDEH